MVLFFDFPFSGNHSFLNTLPENQSKSSQNEFSSPDAYSVELMLRAKEDDLVAFEALVKENQGKVANLIYQMMGSSADVDDLAQQVFIKLWNSRKSYQPKAKFLTFLFTITKRLVFNEVKRAHRRYESMVLDAKPEEGGLGEILPSEQEDATELALKMEKSQAIDRAIAALPEKARLAILLKKDDQLSYEEIANVVGVSVSALKSLLFRARTELKEALSKYLAD